MKNIFNKYQTSISRFYSINTKFRSCSPLISHNSNYKLLKLYSSNFQHVQTSTNYQRLLDSFITQLSSMNLQSQGLALSNKSSNRKSSFSSLVPVNSVLLTNDR